MELPEVLERIRSLKARRKAVILAHNYQSAEVQDLADFVGDSLELSRRAAALESETVVFCGVHFMAETAAILAPGKTVLLPDLEAGCPMADMITAEDLLSWKKRYPGRKVVCYVNTSAAVKAESDICCTSSNALGIVDSLGEKEVLFVPDRNLAAYIASRTSTKVISWDGWCYVHDRFRPSDVEAMKRLRSDSEVWVHPECRPDVIGLADRVLSTGKMVAAARMASARTVILGTEVEIIHRLRQENAAVEFLPLKESAWCSNMKKITPAKVLRALEEGLYRVSVPPAVAARARGAIQAMIKVS